VIDCSAEGFALAMGVFCHSFLRTAKLAEPLMPNGGCLLAVTFHGSERVVEHDNLMGPVKAALESSVRDVAAELGQRGIRAHAVAQAHPCARAASGTDRLDASQKMDALGITALTLRDKPATASFGCAPFAVTPSQAARTLAQQPGPDTRAFSIWANRIINVAPAIP